MDKKPNPPLNSTNDKPDTQKGIFAKNTGKNTPAKPSRGLGRGLSALMSDIGALNLTEDDMVNAVTPSEPENVLEQKNKISPLETDTFVTKSTTIGKGVTTIALDRIVRNPDQPRRHFDPKALQELTDSVADKGVLQPLLVRPIPAHESDSRPLYQIVAGERRWQASLRAKLDNVPVLIKKLSDREVLEIGVVENVQRADLNPIEEALAYRALIDQFDRTQDDVAKAIGKSRSHVANMLRLLNLPEAAQDALKQGQISMGHARAVIAAPDANALVEQIIQNGLSVRDAENWAKRLKKDENAPAPQNFTAPEKTPDIKRIEKDLSDILGVQVDLNHKNPNGELRLKYKTDAQLDLILYRLRG
ncbi:MAG: ParB/RepB/Spo0J family partition protein [Maricaulaceae bacterium]